MENNYNSVLQFYDPIEAQKTIVKLGSNFHSLQKKPRTSCFRIHCTLPEETETEFDAEVITSITSFDLPVEDYVYDLSTESNHFQSGVGTIVVHNTDSVAISFPEHWSEEEGFKNANDLSEEITAKLFKAPCKLEFEKIYSPYILLKKKHYAGLKKEFLDDNPVMDVKGLCVVRRENSFLIVDFLNRVLELLLIHRSPSQVCKELEEYLKNIVEGNVPMSKFIMGKTMKDREEYKDPDSIAHFALACKHNKRAGYEHYTHGDRVEYIQYIPQEISEYFERTIGKQSTLWGSQVRQMPNARQLKTIDKIEDPKFIQENGLRIDYDYYIDALQKKLADIVQFYFIKNDVNCLFKTYLRIFDTPMYFTSKKDKRKQIGGSKPVQKKAKKTFADFQKKK
jgi:DNA polymerase delta subunit 1